MQFILQNILWLILGGSVLLLGFFAWLIMSGKFHRMIDWLAPNRAKHIQARVFSEDKQIRNRKLAIGRHVISDNQNHQSFHLIHDLLITVAGTRKQFIALGVRDAVPIDFQHKLTPEFIKTLPTAQRVFLDTTSDIRSDASKESLNNSMGMSLSIIVLGFAVIVGIMALVYFWQSRGQPEEVLIGVLSQWL